MLQRSAALAPALEGGRNPRSSLIWRLRGQAAAPHSLKARFSVQNLHYTCLSSPLSPNNQPSFLLSFHRRRRATQAEFNTLAPPPGPKLQRSSLPIPPVLTASPVCPAVSAYGSLVLSVLILSIESASPTLVLIQLAGKSIRHWF